MPADQFALQHAEEISEALTIIERNGGAFELIGHGLLPELPEQPGSEPALYAVVRSSDSGTTYLLVRTANPLNGRASRWHEVSAADLPHFRHAPRRAA